LAKILVLAVLSLIVFLVFTDDPTNASMLAVDDEDPVATISPADGSSVLHTAEIAITITDNVGVSLGATTYTVEKDNVDYSELYKRGRRNCFSDHYLRR
jgi:hypothetical protein